MTIHYFAADGNYGDATNLVIVDTSDWTEDEWADIDFAIDANRPMIALSLSTNDNVKNPDQLELQFPIKF
ncbi:hypothetical protein [Actinomycetia phage DSL-LC01]|nr:hypothetical protein [Actinomycetia phage DSL-LC01]